MSIWYVHRREDGTIASAHEEMQKDYAEEALDDASGELAEWFVKVNAPPPVETSKLRFALELRERGLWPTVKAAIEADEEASLYWELADVVSSDNALLLAMAGKLGVNEAQVREIIAAAAARAV